MSDQFDWIQCQALRYFGRLPGNTAETGMDSCFLWLPYRDQHIARERVCKLCRANKKSPTLNKIGD
ncbi:MAG TPA: hypothetical protein VIC51_03135 [Psychromonas sp.]